MPHKKPRDTPIISRTLADGTILEALFDPVARTTALAVAAPRQTPKVVASYSLPSGEALTPYSPDNSLIASGCVLLPSTVGDFGDIGDLVADVGAYLARYVDLSPDFRVVAAHYVLLSWVYDAFNELPYLRFKGDYGTGKTRALLVIGSICYKPFFASGASTVSPIFHILDVFGGTLVLDEADLRFSDATADLTKILNNGNARGLPVLRTMQNKDRELNPRAFSVFGPKIIGMRQRFRDDALESRFLTEDTGLRPVSPSIPINLPDCQRDEALGLRNRLLAWRFAGRHTVGPDPAKLVAGLSHRASQIGLPLLSIASDESARAAIARELVGREARVLRERASTLEATMLGAVRDAFAEAKRPYVSIATVMCRFNEVRGSTSDAAVSAKWVGSFVRMRLGLDTMKTNGTYALPQSERAKLDVLLRRYGLDQAGNAKTN